MAEEGQTAAGRTNPQTRERREYMRSSRFPFVFLVYFVVAIPLPASAFSISAFQRFSVSLDSRLPAFAVNPLAPQQSSFPQRYSVRFWASAAAIR